MNSDVERVKHDILYPYISKYNYVYNATFYATYSNACANVLL